VTVDARLVTPDEKLPSAPLAVANISQQSVEALPGRTDARMLVTSGYFEVESPQLRGFEHVRRTTLDGWACDVFRRTQTA
jgi:hypothetical protein